MNQTIIALHRLVEEAEPNICEITVMQEGNVCYEDYWHGFGPGDALNVMSVTKSVIALLVGIAMDRGYIVSVEQKVLDFFPEYSVKRGEKTIYDVTLYHLLTMTAPYKYKSEPWTKVCTSEDWTKAALDLLGGRGGLTGAFKYATLGIQILAGVIEQASGRKLLDFANEYLFSPLGIPESVNHGDSSKEDQFDFLMNKNPRKHEWYSDPKNTVTAGWGLTLSATDMARIGQMCLEGGVFRGRRILSDKWIREVTTPYQTLGERFGYMSYGYLWWIPDKEKRSFAAIGDGGNVIYVNPEKKVAIGVAGTFKPRIFDRIDFIEQKILPVVLGEQNT